MLRTLEGFSIIFDKRLMPRFTVGNTAVMLHAERGGRRYTLRCFMRPTPHRREIYGGNFHPEELYIPAAGEWIDVVVTEWIEGVTLHEATLLAARMQDRAELAALSLKFDRFAAGLLAEEWAHGDLKPENIVLTDSGELRLIDFDAMFLPEFAGEHSPELGTAAFQHPRRTAADFDARLDDYPAAVISTTLAALALDPQSVELYTANEGTLFEPRSIATNPHYHKVLRMFEHIGDTIHYRTAQLLRSTDYRIPDAGRILQLADLETAIGEEQVPELFVEGGRWGYRTPQGIVSPPLWDCGFDFSEGLAAVQLGHSWHYIDLQGRVVRSFPECEALKPFRNGTAEVIRCGIRRRLTRKGGGIR